MLQDDEHFAQWLITDDNYRYYNPAFFSSNYGYTISVFNNGIKVLKANLKTGGWGSNNQTRWTDYIKSYYPKWESDMLKGYEPQYFYYINSYPQSRGLIKSQKQVIVHKAFALYFLSDGYLVLDGKHEVHHKIAFDWSKPAQYSNVASNLQVLLEDDTISVKDSPEAKQHTFLHNAARDTSPESWISMLERASSPDTVHGCLTEEEFVRFLNGYLKTMYPITPTALNFKNEDGSQYMNVYASSANIETIN